MNKIEPFEDPTGGKTKPFMDLNVCKADFAFTSIADDLFQPIGLYVGDPKQIPIVFDSG